MKKFNFIILLLSVALLISLWALYKCAYKSEVNSINNLITINSFEECVAQGYPIMEIYPEQCKTPDGKLFVRQLELNMLSFVVPDTSTWQYSSFQDWHFTAKKVDSEFVLMCEETDQKSSLPFRRKMINISNRDYCVEAMSEGAAGSVYTEYLYSTLINDSLVNVEVTVRDVNCSNYDEDQILECQKEREEFNLDIIIDSSIKSDFFN